MLSALPGCMPLFHLVGCSMAKPAVTDVGPDIRVPVPMLLFQPQTQEYFYMSLFITEPFSVLRTHKRWELSASCLSGLCLPLVPGPSHLLVCWVKPKEAQSQRVPVGVSVGLLLMPKVECSPESWERLFRHRREGMSTARRVRRWGGNIHAEDHKTVLQVSG